MALSPELEADLKKLAFTVEMAEGEFRLVFAHCNYVLLQQQLADRLGELTGIVTLRLQPGERTLAQVLELLRRRGGSLPPGVQVLGMEQMGDLPGGLAKLDQTRDQLQTQFPLPIVVWVNDDLQTAWKRYAPNLESWGAPKEFELDDETVVELIALKTTQLMERGWRLSTGEAEFLKLELAKAWARLEGKPLKDKTRAQLEALRGLTAEQLGDWLFGDPDFKHYQYALAYEGVWSTVESALLRRNSAWCGLRSGLAPEPAEIGSWIDGAQAGLMNSEHWQESLPGLALTAWKLRDWARLQGLVAGETSPVALTYQALLAWHQQGREQAALALIEQAQAQWPQDRRPVERLLLIQLGGEIRAEQEDWQGLVNWLETAMAPLMALWTAPEPAFDLPGALQPEQTAKDLFLGILERCRETYFVWLRDYRKAFTYSQTLTRVKKQMGDYAFIGAGRMEAAAELEAAGRDQDVRALKERILKPEHRLVILYGQSGVGKSSLLQAGLAPALKSQALGQARLCPVYVRRYDKKLEELTAGLELPAGADWEAIIARAREWDRQERRLVLIFDQFEEFFFAFPQRKHQQRFFDGLAALLKAALSAKVVLSLRKDYLHLLVDYPQIAPNAAGVLAADNLYELRDFTPEAATQLIERLTAKSNFAMSPLLIQTVVADLTREGKVRPIELQILGAQLQEQKRDIRGLSQYDAAGGKPQLLRDYVSQATRACGPENINLAGATLFLLTDEQERRLLKTRSELAEGLAQLGQRFEPSQLDLALDILGRSGLVVEIPEEPEARYQILHDYLVGLIRAQQEPLLAQLAAELEQEKAQRIEAEGRLAQIQTDIEAATQAKSALEADKVRLENERIEIAKQNKDARRRLKATGLIAIGILGVSVIGGLWGYSQNQQIQAETERIQIEAEEKQKKADGDLKQAQIKLDLVEKDKKKVDQDLAAARRKNKDADLRLKKAAANYRLAQEDLTQATAEKNRIQSASAQEIAAATARVEKARRSFDQAELERLSAEIAVRSARAKQQELESQAKALQEEQAKLQKANQAAQDNLTASQIQALTTKAEALHLKNPHSLDALLVSLESGGVALKAMQKKPSSAILAQQLPTALKLNQLRQDVRQRHEKNAQSGVWSVAAVEGGKRLVSGSYDGKVRVWDLASQSDQPLHTFDAGKSWVWSVAAVEGGKRLVSGSSDGKVRVWDLASQSDQPLHTFDAGKSWVLSVAAVEGGKRLVSGSDDGKVRVWDLASQSDQPLHTFDAQSRVLSVAAVEGGKRLVSGSDDGKVRVWDLDLVSLMGRGCRWAQQYLESHPEETKLREICRQYYSVVD